LQRPQQLLLAKNHPLESDQLRQQERLPKLRGLTQNLFRQLGKWSAEDARGDPLIQRSFVNSLVL
jgi:hypothetical protein